MLDADGRERDRLGRLVPRRLNWVTLNRAVPGLLGRFHAIPDGYWHRENGGATVTCPCGHMPHVDQGDCVRCECERFYLLASSVFVANSPRAPVGAAVD